MTLVGGAMASPALWLRAASAQPRIRRVGVLSQGWAAAHPTPLFHAFQLGLRDLGWVEGHNLVLEWRFSEGSFEPLPRLAGELVGLPADVIVASPTRPALAAKEATSTIPIVFIQSADPVETGIVNSLSRTGTNITGLSSIASDLSGKRLELLREILPGAARVAILWHRPSQAAAAVFRELERTSAQIGVTLEDIGVAEAAELKRAMAAAVQARVAAVMVVDGPMIASLQRQIVSLATERGLPIISQYADFAEGGGLMAYGPSLLEIYRRGAIYVDRILRGAKPSELPVEQPAVFELVINLRTAKALGLEVAPTLLARATRVIE